MYNIQGDGRPCGSEGLSSSNVTFLAQLKPGSPDSLRKTADCLMLLDRKFDEIRSRYPRVGRLGGC